MYKEIKDQINGLSDELRRRGESRLDRWLLRIAASGCTLWWVLLGVAVWIATYYAGVMRGWYWY